MRWARLVGDVAREADNLLTFFCTEGVRATNVRAEQALRPMMVNHKRWGGNKTLAGAVSRNAAYRPRFG
jgi:hypothetical protein